MVVRSRLPPSKCLKRVALRAPLLVIALALPSGAAEAPATDDARACAAAVLAPNPWLDGRSQTRDPDIVATVCAGTETRIDAALCYRKVEAGLVAWNPMGLTPDRRNFFTQWRPENGVALCRGTRPGAADALISCFEAQIAAGADWDAALAVCRNDYAGD